MKLKLVYENETDIPEGYKDLFEERDGKWLLVGIEGMKTQADVDKVQGALTKERKARGEADAKLKKYEKLADKDPEELLKSIDEVVELRAQLEELTGEGGKDGKAKSEDAKTRLDAAVTRATAKIQRDLDNERKAHDATKAKVTEADTRASGLDQRIRRSTIEGDLTRAASGLKVRSEALADLLRYSDIFEVDEDGKTVRTKDGVGVTPGIDAAAWLSDMKATRPHWWPESQGGGARGGNGAGAISDNPFDKRAPNITKAMAMAKVDPAKAEAAARAAGYPTMEAAVRGMASGPQIVK